MRITIVTPSFNRATYINDTIGSIVSQQGDFELEYIIQDGGSDDSLIEIYRKWQRRIENNEIEIKCKSLNFKFFIETDDGMYDAINRGFSHATGDVMAWLNSDDMYHPYALQTVAQVFSKFNNVSWLTGIPNSFNSYGSRSGFDTFPPAYSQLYIRKGFYNVKYHRRFGFNWIQQESNFWRSSLWNQVGGKVSTDYKYAADFNLWQEFARHTDLVKVHSFLGGFRVHPDQFTSDPHLYAEELPKIDPPSESLYRLRRIMGTIPLSRRLFFNKRKGKPFLTLLGLQFENLTGRSIEWSFQENDWVMQLRAII